MKGNFPWTCWIVHTERGHSVKRLNDLVYATADEGMMWYWIYCFQLLNKTENYDAEQFVATQHKLRFNNTLLLLSLSQGEFYCYHSSRALSFHLALAVPTLDPGRSFRSDRRRLTALRLTMFLLQNNGIVWCTRLHFYSISTVSTKKREKLPLLSERKRAGRVSTRQV